MYDVYTTKQEVLDNTPDCDVLMSLTEAEYLLVIKALMVYELDMLKEVASTADDMPLLRDVAKYNANAAQALGVWMLRYFDEEAD